PTATYDSGSGNPSHERSSPRVHVSGLALPTNSRPPLRISLGDGSYLLEFPRFAAIRLGPTSGTREKM
ncbi:hypothetical protein, partial [Paraliomyxa miuraensis]|uniref:hypothetical protein n=1 Tax=Paraliomyxa miuraensis TaxID=376150 RepID=UPI00224FFC42